MVSELPVLRFYREVSRNGSVVAKSLYPARTSLSAQTEQTVPFTRALITDFHSLPHFLHFHQTFFLDFAFTSSGFNYILPICHRFGGWRKITSIQKRFCTRSIKCFLIRSLTFLLYSLF